MIPIVNHSLKYNPSIDGLRGISISLVLLFHIWPEYFPFGYLGVDVFFLLSGYLITQIIFTKLENNNFSFKEFYRNRVRRIFPAMLIVLLSTYLIGYLFMFPSELQQLGQHIESSSFFYQNFRLMSEVGYWDEASKFKPLLHFWSLSIEEQFYLAWPFIIFIIYKSRLHFISSLLVITIIMFCFPYFFELDLFYNSFARFWELCFGGLLFAFYSKYSFSAPPISNKLLEIKPLVFLGLISFPLYLWHYVVISYMHIFGLNVELYGILIIVMSIFFSYLTYIYVELYARKQTSYIFVIALFFAALSLGLFGKFIEIKKGFPLRAHLENNDAMNQQFKKVIQQDENGKYFLKNELGYELKYDFVRATNKDKNDVLVLGDSHAYSSYDGLASELKMQNLDTFLLAKNSCVPYLGDTLGRNEFEAKACHDAMIDFMKIAKAYKFQKIFFITRGPKYITKTGFGTIDNEETIKEWRFYKFDSNDNEKMSHKERFYDNTDKTFGYLDSLNIPIYYILENPELGFSPKNCANRPFNIFKNECKIKYEEYKNRTFEYKNKIREIVNNYKNIRVIDPENAFCDDQYCYAMKDEKMLYADDDHLSINGSELQAKYLINKVLNAK
ncbi:MAG: acyltransferase family protein [Arcobacteraceae bacterium]